ncbi:hypothetical protein HDU99_005903 [Rhizoclosmatium hyalinum]|nr:hypothetical protein HDU99_005903 [Rhizoclosmatium hyalinum]
MLYAIRLVPKAVSSSTLPPPLNEGETTIGRGFQGLSDGQLSSGAVVLSRKQLSVLVDASAGTIFVTRLGNNPSRFLPAATSATSTTSAASVVAPPKELPKDTPVQLFHGDTLFLVGLKHAFTVVVEHVSTTMALPTQALGTIALAGGGPSLTASLGRATTFSKKGGSTLAQSLSGGFAENKWDDDLDIDMHRITHQEKERRWTDDEDDDGKFDTKKFGIARKTGAKRRVCRADFSDESDDLFGFEDEAIELIHTRGDSGLTQTKDETALSPKAKKPRRSTSTVVPARPHKKKTLQLNPVTSDSINSSVESSSPAKPKTPRVTRSQSYLSAIERRRRVEELRQKRTQSRVSVIEEGAEEGEDDDDDEEVEGVGARTRKSSVQTKRRITAYAMYSKEERKKIKNENPNASTAEVTAMLRSRFNLLQDNDRDHYHALAAEKNGEGPSSSSLPVAPPPPPPRRKLKRVTSVRPETVQEESSAESEEIPLLSRRKIKVIPESLDVEVLQEQQHDSDESSGSPIIMKRKL